MEEKMEEILEEILEPTEISRTTEDTSPQVADLIAEGNVYAPAARSRSTQRAYRADWAHFTAWCQSRNLASLPAIPETVAFYLSDHGTALSPATLQRRLAAIAKAHHSQKLESPTKLRHAAFNDVLQSILRVRGTAQRSKAALLTNDLRKLILAQPHDTLRGLRNKLLLLLGFAGAFRRSELCALQAEDVVEVTEGLEITIRKSKTDQPDKGATIALPHGFHLETCPVRTWRAWVSELDLTTGPLLRSVDRFDRPGAGLNHDSVGRLIKECCLEAGMTDPGAYAGHSLRAGMITQALTNGATESEVIRISRHKSTNTLQKYNRGSRWTNNAAKKLGL